MIQLCTPAFIYLFISLVDVIYNAYLGLYNNLLIKTLVVLSVTIFLNMLCEKGFSEISWLVVLVSFIFVGMIMLTDVGCDIYNMPEVNIPEVISFKSYNHAPTGTSDPQYKS